MKPAFAATSAPIKAEKIDEATVLPLLIKQEKSPSPPSYPAAAIHAHAFATEAGEGEDAPLNSQETATESGGEEEDGNPLLHSVARLRGLSFALSNFTRRFRDMETHLKSVQKSIREKSQELDSLLPQPPQQIQEAPQQQPREERRQQRREDRLKFIHQSNRDKSQELDSLQAQPPQQIEEAPPQQRREGPPPPPHAATPATSSSPDLRRICSTMSSKALKKYVAASMASDAGVLRDEVSEALKFAPDPGRLVLDCIGRFYLQGSKAFSRNSQANVSLNLCIVLLEFFILSGCSKIEPLVKDEAERAAVAWRRRIVNEGGICSASSEDALGLLLLVAAFGIPAEFGMDDLCELIRVSNIREKADALCCSPLFLGKFEDVIQGLMDKGSHITAVNLSCALGLEDKFSPKSLLSSFLSETYRTAKNMRRQGQGSFEKQKEACEKQLAALKSVIKCVDDNKLDSVNLSSWKINEKISKLENKLSRFVPKRKSIEDGSLENKTQVKRHQPTTVIASPQPPSVTRPQERQLHKLPAKILSNDGRPQASLNRLSGAMQSNGSGVGLFWTGNALGSVAGTSAAPAAGAGLLTALGAVPGTGSAPSGNGPSIGSGMGLLWTGNTLGAVAGTSTGPAVGAGLLTPSGAGPFIGSGNEMHTGAGAGSLTNNWAGLNGWQMGGAYGNLVGQLSFVGLPPIVGQLPAGPPLPMVERFPGLLQRGSCSSNIFQFVDTVLQCESSHHTSSSVGNLAPAAPSADRPSYY